jgi:glucose-1-phosphate adenylyltransferase
LEAFKTIFRKRRRETLFIKDFGKDIMPAMLQDDCKLFVYLFKGYWKDNGTFQSLWEGNMDLLSADTNLILQNEDWAIYTHELIQPPFYLE